MKRISTESWVAVSALEQTEKQASEVEAILLPGDSLVEELNETLLALRHSWDEIVEYFTRFNRMHHKTKLLLTKSPEESLSNSPSAEKALHSLVQELEKLATDYHSAFEHLSDCIKSGMNVTQQLEQKFCRRVSELKEQAENVQGRRFVASAPAMVVGYVELVLTLFPATRVIAAAAAIATGAAGATGAGAAAASVSREQNQLHQLSNLDAAQKFKDLSKSLSGFSAATRHIRLEEEHFEALKTASLYFKEQRDDTARLQRLQREGELLNAEVEALKAKLAAATSKASGSLGSDIKSQRSEDSQPEKTENVKSQSETGKEHPRNNPRTENCKEAGEWPTDRRKDKLFRDRNEEGA